MDNNIIFIQIEEREVRRMKRFLREVCIIKTVVEAYSFYFNVIVRECGQTLGLGLVDKNRTVVLLLVYNGHRDRR